MATIHEQIDELLAAEVHGQLPDSERAELHNHLVECATCRELHQDNKIMNKILEETLAAQKADPAFEQRMLAGFRSKIPQRPTLIALLMNARRLRITQVAAVAALLLALVQVGRVITHEDVSKEYASNNEVAVVTGSNIPLPEKAARFAAGKLSTTDEKDKISNYVNQAQSPVAAAGLLERSRIDQTRPVPAAPLGSRQALERAAQAKPASSAVSKPEETSTTAPEPQANRKLIRNATVELEIRSFDEAIQKITAFANEGRGYVATSGSLKQANGKLRGEVVIKLLPENLDRFLQKVRGLGELKNQTIGTEDVTKRYFDTDARLRNERVMEQRLIDMLNTKTGKVSDLLQVERELGRVREQIEKLQGDLKFWDSQVQFATVTISLAEKDLEEPAAFLLKERAQLALYTAQVEKIYNDVKALASPKTQITSAQLDRDNTGRVSARISVLIAPEESEAQIARIKSMGRVENFQIQTERVAQGGNPAAAGSENARTKRDMVELNITISRDEQEQSLQQTGLRIRTSAVDEKTKELRTLAEKQGGRVLSSSFNRDAEGREFANVLLRVPMRNYPSLMQSLKHLGTLENVTVQREDRTGSEIDVTNAPADVSVQVYSQGNIVSRDSGLVATVRRTIGQSAAAIMWSLRMIGVALAFLAPWVVALVAAIWIGRRIVHARGR